MKNIIKKVTRNGKKYAIVKIEYWNYMKGCFVVSGYELCYVITRCGKEVAQAVRNCDLFKTETDAIKYISTLQLRHEISIAKAKARAREKGIEKRKIENVKRECNIKWAGDYSFKDIENAYNEYKYCDRY